MREAAQSVGQRPPQPLRGPAGDRPGHRRERLALASRVASLMVFQCGYCLRSWTVAGGLSWLRVRPVCGVFLHSYLKAFTCPHLTQPGPEGINAGGWPQTAERLDRLSYLHHAPLLLSECETSFVPNLRSRLCPPSTARPAGQPQSHQSRSASFMASSPINPASSLNPLIVPSSLTFRLFKFVFTLVASSRPKPNVLVRSSSQAA